MSAVNTGLIKVLAVVLVFCFAECAAGSCLNYGHACWGAHGKRSGEKHPDKEEIGNFINQNWFLSRLIQNPSDLRYALENDALNAKDRTDFLTNSGERSRGEEWNQVSDDQLFEDPHGHFSDSNRIRLSKRMVKRSISRN